MKRKFFLLLTICILSNSLYAINAKQIVKKVKQKYETLKSLKAHFKQEYKWALAGETQTVEGVLLLKAGNKYRIETDTQIIVTDGNIVWTYSKHNNQVIIDYLTHSSENPLPKDLLFKYSEEFVPHFVKEEKIDGKKVYLLNLVPKDKEAFIVAMKIWVDAESWLTVKIQQTDLNDNVNTYIISKIEENIDLPDRLFTFQIPPDAEVVDMR